MTHRSVGVDVGGTFTDVVAWDGAGIAVAKVSSTSDQSEGVVDGARRLADLAEVDSFLHGTTVATNALLERKGAEVALITTAGFGDVLEIGRQDRPSLYDSFADRPGPLVPAGRRFQLSERLDHDGSIISPVDAVEATADAVLSSGAEAAAVALLYSYVTANHEEQLADALGSLPASLSSHVVPEVREFERISTTVLNAYLMPVVSDYLNRLVDRCRVAGFTSDVQVMRSSGGLINPARAAELPASILVSGPAGGVVATAELSKAMGYRRAISFDMGGTSTDVCRVEDGRPEVAYERAIEGYPCLMPSVAVHTVGAGGGSLGWIDPGGALRVGPASAGADPGPACYGWGGTEPAITDANVALGRIGATARLGGSVALDPVLAEGALAAIGGELQLDHVQVAGGMVEIVEAHMERAIRAVSVEEGADPRDGVLVAFGGAGGLHATALARQLGMRAVAIPPHAGVFSALGLLLSPPRIDRSVSVLLTPATADRLAPAVSQLVSAASAEGEGEASVSLDVRYVGQSHETQVDHDPGESWEQVAARFHDAHRVRNGFARPDDPIEVVTVRVAVVGEPPLRWDELPVPKPAGERQRGVRPVWLDGDYVDTDIYWRPALLAGEEIAGPAVIEEGEATTLIGPGEVARVHDNGTLEISW